MHQRKMTRQKTQLCEGTESGWKRENTVVEKVGCEREFMIGTIKEENLQGKTHCVIEKMRDKERKIGVNRCC
jgi:hypothetical protein